MQETNMLEAAIARDRSGQGNEAIGLLDNLLSYQPGHRMALFYRGACKIRYRKDIPEAMQDWDAAFEGAPPGSPARVAELYKGIYESCMEKLAGMTSQDPYNAYAHWGFGHANKCFEQWDPAERHLSRALDLDPTLVRPALVLAELQRVQLQSPEAALQTLQKASEASPDAPELLYAQAVLHQAAGATALALKQLEAAIKLETPHIPSRRLLAEIYLLQGRYEQAQPLLQQVLKMAPSAAVHLALAECDKQQYRFDEALQHYRQAVALEPGNFRAVADLGAMALQFGDIPLGTRCLRQALTIEPRHPEIWGHLAKAALQQNDTQEAIKALRQQLELDPEDGFACYSLATQLRLVGDVRESSMLLARALEKRPTDVQICLELAACHMHLGRREAAVALVREAYQRNPTHEDLRTALQRLDPSAVQGGTRGPSVDELLNLARAHLSAGRPEAAMESFRQVLALDPNQREAMQLLARIYDGRGLHEPAADLLLQSYALEPRNPAPLLELFGILDRMALFEVKEVLERLALVLPQDIQAVPWLAFLWEHRESPGVDKHLVGLLGGVQKVFPPGHPVMTQWLDLQTA